MHICIIGAGYVGLATAACFAEMGNDVYCVDADERLMECLLRGELPLYEPGLEALIGRNHAEGRLAFTPTLSEGLARARIAFICVGTPSGEGGACDLRHVETAARDIGRFMSAPLLIVDKSTVPVGTADRVRELVAEELRRRGEEIAFDVVSNPEFLKEGNAVADFLKPDRVIVGTDSEESAALMRELYAPFARVREKVMVMSVRSAEMTKYAANCMLATKISFINEIASICEKIGADVREVRAGIGADPRIGPYFIYPGVGYGGSCFPKDVKALIHTAEEVGVAPSLLRAVEKVNARQKLRMAERAREYFEPRGGVRGRTLALWGLAFKANTDDMREAAALDIINALTSRGMRVRAFDPAAGDNAVRLLGDNPLVEIVREQYAACESADALMVVTEWNQFRNPDFERIRGLLSSPVLFDGRNLYNPSRMARLGFTYVCVGRGEKKDEMI